MLKLIEEVGELSEHFQWQSEAELKKFFAIPAHRAAAGEEAMDVLTVLLLIIDYLKLDVATAFAQKIKKNGLKYPLALKKI